MIVMLYEVYFKSVDDACGALDCSFPRRKPITISNGLLQRERWGQHRHRADGVLHEAIKALFKGVSQTIKNRKAVQNSQLLP
jgi:hypothetical protein